MKKYLLSNNSWKTEQIVQGDMVLYKRKPIVLPAPKSLPENLNIKVWHINETGEWFTTYEDYLERLDFYTRHYFTCEITGASCLTFFEALNSEEMQFKHVEEKFPLKLREPVARFLHFNEVRRIDLLVEQVYARFKNDYFPGETVFLRKSVSKNSSPTPGAEDVEAQHAQHQKPYVIKEKAQFNAIIDPITGEEKSPAYSKYMIVEASGLRSVIADQNQIYRDRTTFTKHLIKCFCKITLRRASTKMGAPWCVKEEYLPMYGLSLEWPADMLKYKDDYADTTTQIPFTSTAEENSDKRKVEIDQAEVPEPKKTKNDDGLQSNEVQSQAQSQQITSIVDDLKLPFAGSRPKLKSVYYYSKLLNHVNLENTAEVFPEMGRLLQVYQFINTFNETLNISNFTLDDLITSFKCTSPDELSGLAVKVSVEKDISLSEDVDEGLDNVTCTVNSENEFMREKMQVDSDVFQIIDRLSTERTKYQIVKQDRAADELLDEAPLKGAALLVECFAAILRMFIDETGDWNCIVAENWYRDGEPKGNHNDLNLKTNDEGINDTLSGENTPSSEPRSESQIDELLDKCLQYRNVNWSERLMNRQFQNGYWLIIVLGIYQDCMHLPIYSNFIQSFVELVVPIDGAGTQLNKILWRNFCRNLDMEQKVYAMWILVDLLSNFSSDIKGSLEDSMEICGQIRSERFKIGRDLKSSTAALQALENDLRNIVEENSNPDKIEELKEKICRQKEIVENLQEDRNYLDSVLFENDLQRLRSLGSDRYGNRYYWLELSGVKRPQENEHNPKPGCLWIQGPSIIDAQYFLQISKEEIERWVNIRAKKSSKAATEEVFNIYRVHDGSYKHKDGNGETVLVDENGSVNNWIALSPIQRKIIEEGPESLLLSDQQWLSVEAVEDFEKLCGWFDVWGRREHDLSRQLKSVEKELKLSLRLKEQQLASTTVTCRITRLLKELDESQISEDEWDAKARMRYIDTKDEEELEAIAEEIMKLDDSSKTRHALNEIDKLEARRDELMARKLQGGLAKQESARVQLRAERQINSVSVKNRLINQETILTELINVRNHEAYKLCTFWKNATALELWGTSLYGGAKGKPKGKARKRLDEKMGDILRSTSRKSTSAVVS